MRTGQRRQRLTIQRKTETIDGVGQRIPTWATHLELWGSVMPLGGREAERARQVRVDASHTVEIRGPADVTTADRIVWGSRVLEIGAIEDFTGKQARLTLTCAETR